MDKENPKKPTVSMPPITASHGKSNSDLKLQHKELIRRR